MTIFARRTIDGDRSRHYTWTDVHNRGGFSWSPVDGKGYCFDTYGLAPQPTCRNIKELPPAGDRSADVLDRALPGSRPAEVARAADPATPFRCGGRYHQIVGPHGIGGVLFLKEHDISCPTAEHLGQALLNGDVRLTPHHPARAGRFVCRYVPINAGGGAARCADGPHWILFGFE